MDQVQNIIENTAFPIKLSEGCFITLGQKRIPDFDRILAQLPNVFTHVDLNATAPGGGPQEYFIPLKDGRYLKLCLSGEELVSMSIVGESSS